MSCKSLNLPQALRGFQNGGVSRAFIMSLVARPGSAPTLAIIERIWLGFFGLTFAFVGFSSMIAQGLISAFWHCYRFERGYVVEHSLMFVLLWTLLTYPLRMNVNWKKKRKKKRKYNKKKKTKCRRGQGSKLKLILSDPKGVHSSC